MSAIAHDLLEAAVGRFPRDALTPVRSAALARFGNSGFPTIRDEDWKYTNLSGAAELSNAWLADGSVSSPQTTWSTAAKRAVDEILDNIDACWIVIANGITSVETLSAARSLSDQGIDIARLTDDDSSSAIVSDDQMTSFNAALLRDGLRVRIRPSDDLSKPLGFLFIDNVQNGCLSQGRLIIEVQANAKIGLIEAHVSVGTEAHFANTVVQLSLAEGARARYVRTQDRADRHIQTGKLIAELHKDAVLDYAGFDFGGSLVRNDVSVNVAQAGATVNLHGLYLAGSRQHIDNHTRVDHRVGPGVSREEYRGIIGGRARCVFNGKAIVHEGADGTDAEQSNHNLLLSDTAEVDTKPELEIYADDVKCAHGATVGQLDKPALFYLQSRGLGRDEAARLLTRAFAARLLTVSPIEETHAYIAEKTDRRLDALIDSESQ